MHSINYNTDENLIIIGPWNMSPRGLLSQSSYLYPVKEMFCQQDETRIQEHAYPVSDQLDRIS